MRLYGPLIALSVLVEHLRDRARTFSDKVVYSEAISVDDRTGNLLVRNGSTTEHPFQPHALGLLASKLRIPASYLTRCPPELRAINLNHWLRKLGGRRLFLRFDGEECRAVLSDRYRPVSNVDLAQTLLSSSRDLLVRAEVDNLRMVVQVVNGRSTEIRPGDRVHGGLHVRNSEVGYTAVELRAILYRVLCTNGLILGGGAETYRKRHVVDPDAVLSDFGRRAVYALEEGTVHANRLGDTRNVRVPDPQPVLDRIGERYHLADDEKRAMQQAFHREPGNSLFEVIQAVTGAGNDRALGIDSREKMQELGGRLLELASSGRRWID